MPFVVLPPWPLTPSSKFMLVRKRSIINHNIISSFICIIQAEHAFEMILGDPIFCMLSIKIYNIGYSMYEKFMSMNIKSFSQGTTP